MALHLAICGGGWLGLPLAQTLKQRGHRIVATGRSEERVWAIKKARLESLCFELGQPLDSCLAPLFECDVLILNIPPGRRDFQPDFFINNMCSLIKHAAHKGVKHVVFISTTAVYGDQQGLIKENTSPMPLTASAKAHVQIEQTLWKTFAKSASVMRLSGLVGGERHPARYLAGKKDIPQPTLPVNLVHQEDVIQALVALLEQKKFGEPFHLSANKHPTREAYYTWAANKLGLAPPQFLSCPIKSSDVDADSISTQGKIIDAKYTIAKLGIQLRYPSPYDFLS